jgi:hypothetical protein
MADSEFAGSLRDKLAYVAGGKGVLLSKLNFVEQKFNRYGAIDWADAYVEALNACIVQEEEYQGMFSRLTFENC